MINLCIIQILYDNHAQIRWPINSMGITNDDIRSHAKTIIQ